MQMNKKAVWFHTWNIELEDVEIVIFQPISVYTSISFGREGLYIQNTRHDFMQYCSQKCLPPPLLCLSSITFLLHIYTKLLIVCFSLHLVTLLNSVYFIQHFVLLQCVFFLQPCFNIRTYYLLKVHVVFIYANFVVLPFIDSNLFGTLSGTCFHDEDCVKFHRHFY